MDGSLAAPPPAPRRRHAGRVLHHAFALAPLAAVATLYASSWLAALRIGHWPRPWVDDPKEIAPGCGACDALYGLVLPFLGWSVLGLLFFPVLSVALRRAYPRWWATLLALAFVAGWALLVSDSLSGLPGDRLLWYVD